MTLTELLVPTYRNMMSMLKGLLDKAEAQLGSEQTSTARPTLWGAVAIVPLLWLTACGSDPAYPPPTDSEALAAYARAIRADLIDSPPEHSADGPTRLEPGDSPDEAGRKVGSALLQESERTARLDAPRILASLSAVTVGECEWDSIDPDEIRPHGRTRVEGKIADGYRCSYQVIHDTAARGRVSASGTGYFFQRDGSYDFAGVEEDSFAAAGN